LTGRTRTDHIVVFDGHERLIGQLLQVAIEEATAFTLFGRVVTADKVGTEHNDSKPTDPTRWETQFTRMGLPLIQAAPLKPEDEYGLEGCAEPA
jgi:tRNA-2-methylthio-N6-dimethylallyladenosine synthase